MHRGSGCGCTVFSIIDQKTVEKVLFTGLGKLDPVIFVKGKDMAQMLPAKNMNAVNAVNAVNAIFSILSILSILSIPVTVSDACFFSAKRKQ